MGSTRSIDGSEYRYPIEHCFQFNEVSTFDIPSKPSPSGLRQTVDLPLRWLDKA